MFQISKVEQKRQLTFDILHSIFIFRISVVVFVIQSIYSKSNSFADNPMSFSFLATFPGTI